MSDEVEKPAAEKLLDILNSIGYQGVEIADNREHVIARLMVADWSDAGVIEHADTLLFPDELVRRLPSGKWERKKVYLRVPRESDKRKARADARDLCRSQRIDEVKDKDLFANLEAVCTLTYVIRNDTPPYEPWEPDPLLLEKKYDHACLQAMWAKADRLHEVMNPAPNQLSNVEIVALIAAIAKSRHLGPLVAYGPGAQTSFVVSMVDLLLNSMASKLSSESIAHLIAEHSPRPISSAS